MTPAFLNLLRQHVSAEVYRQLAPDDLWAKVRDDLDEIAFRVLLERIGGRVYQRCRAILRDDHLAEEAFQDTFRDLIRKRGAIASYHAAAAWAYQTATNHAKHLRRKAWFRGKRERVACAEPAVSATPHADHADEVDRLLAALPNRFRRPIELVYWQGLTHAEAAQVLGWPKGTVDSYVAQGLKRMRAEALRLGLPTTLLGTALADPSHAASEAVLDRLATTAWAAASEPLAVAPRWLNWKSVACAGVAAGGVAIGWRANDPVAPPGARGPVPLASITPKRETLQERNARIATDELATPLRDLVQKFYPPPHQVGVVGVRAVGSEVEIEFRVTPPVPDAAGLPSRLQARYCMVLRRLTIRGQSDGQTDWYWIDPDKPMELKIPNPFGPPTVIVRGREEFAAAEKLFARLPPDERAEPDQVRALFGAPGGTVLLPTETRGVSGFPGGLVAATRDGALFVRDDPGWWRSAGTCPGWGPLVADGRVYCYTHGMIRSRPLNDPTAPWEKWCDEPPLALGNLRLGQLFVAGGQLCMTVEPSGLYSRPLTDRTAGWKWGTNDLNLTGVAAAGDTLFATDGKRLFQRPAANPDAAWTPVGPWPVGQERLFVDGDHLRTYVWGPGPIYTRPVSAGPDVPWREIGRVRNPYAP